MRTFFVFFVMAVPFLRLSADVVELRDGSRIEGRILAEKENALEVEIGSNPARTIRRVLIIHHSEIASYSADQEGRISQAQGTEVNRLSGKEYVERLLREAESKVANKNFDGAVQQFQQAVDIAGQEIPSATPEQKVEAKEQRAYGLRLLLAALEGKQEFIESRTDGVQEELNARGKKLEKDWADLQADIQAAREEQKTARLTELGRPRPQNDFAKREEEIRMQIGLHNQRKLEVTEMLRTFEEERIRTTAQIKLVEERVKMAETEARSARSELRRRK